MMFFSTTPTILNNVILSGAKNLLFGVYKTEILRRFAPQNDKVSE